MATKADIIAFLTREFPQSKCVVESVDNGSATVLHHVTTDHLRPGETVSGPLLMTVADVALYVAILGTIGIVPLAVTTIKPIAGVFVNSTRSMATGTSSAVFGATGTNIAFETAGANALK